MNTIQKVEKIAAIILYTESFIQVVFCDCKNRTSIDVKYWVSEFLYADKERNYCLDVKQTDQLTICV